MHTYIYSTVKEKSLHTLKSSYSVTAVTIKNISEDKFDYKIKSKIEIIGKKTEMLAEI